jgi:hypothetical protein
VCVQETILLGARTLRRAAEMTPSKTNARPDRRTAGLNPRRPVVARRDPLSNGNDVPLLLLRPLGQQQRCPNVAAPTTVTSTLLSLAKALGMGWWGAEESAAGRECRRRGI